ncbi:MAG: hypothetical protein LIQ31_01175 [Planctomycetes bacterium]|nr:hypothetical protein [Planctomycetota bacterium]
MTTRFVHATGLVLAALAILMLPAVAGTARAPDGWASGVGNSSQADPFAAGEEAAAQAFRLLGGVPAKIVVVGAAAPQVTPELIEGVKKTFRRRHHLRVPDNQSPHRHHQFPRCPDD